jgi:predicted ester cyclase
MESAESSLEQNKIVVLRFNREVIEQGSEVAFNELMDPRFVNRTAPPGVSPGPDGMRFTFEQVLRPAFPDLKVEIHDQIAEGDKVVTRKTLRGTHRGDFFGIPATNRVVAIEVTDIVRVQGGRYIEHWGSNNLPSVIAGLRGS